MVYFFQITIVATIGIPCSAPSPWSPSYYLAGFLPISTELTLYPGALLLAALFGILDFTGLRHPAVRHARQVPATALFREQGFEPRGWPSWPYVAATALALGAPAALAILTSEERRIATTPSCRHGGWLLSSCGSSPLASLIWRGGAVACALRRAPAGDRQHPPSGRPRTPAVTLSLGLGLSLLVALALIDGNLRELSANLPERAPNFFFIDIQKSEIEGFRSVVEGQSQNGKLVEVPMLRKHPRLQQHGCRQDGRATEGRWVLSAATRHYLRGTVPRTPPSSRESRRPADYAGEPLVSFSSRSRRARIETRRHRDRQRARPQHHREDRHFCKVEESLRRSTSSWCSRPTPLQAPSCLAGRR